MNAKTLSILAGLTVLVVVAAVFLGQERHNTFPQSGELLFPKLMDKINDINEILIESNTDKTTLARHESGWGVKEKEGYPADLEKVKRTLIGMAELRIREPKTKNPELYEKLGLQGKDADESTSTLVTLKSEDSTESTSLVIGQQRPDKSAPSLSEIFVRKPENPQSWLVVGKLPLESILTEWLDKEIVDIESTRIQRVNVTHPGGEVLSLQKTKPDDLDFQIGDLPKGYKISSQFNVNNVASTLAKLTLDNVKKNKVVDFEKKSGVNAILETFDGLQLTVQTTKDGEAMYAKISAAFDPSIIYTIEETDQSAVVEGKKEESKKSPDKKEEKSIPEATLNKAGDDEETKASEPPKPTIKSAEEVQKEVAAINKKLNGWAFEIPKFKVDTFSKKKKELITKQ